MLKNNIKSLLAEQKSEIFDIEIDGYKIITKNQNKDNITIEIIHNDRSLASIVNRYEYITDHVSGLSSNQGNMYGPPVTTTKRKIKDIKSFVIRRINNMMRNV